MSGQLGGWLKMSLADYDICMALPGGGVTFVEAP
jgi:hypothetical protein